MAGRAFVVGGTGQIGRAVVRALARDGWKVTIAHRGRRVEGAPLEDFDVEHRLVDRSAAGELEAALDDGVDVLIDLIAHTSEDARQLVRMSGRVGSLVAISTVAVYADDQGRSLDAAADWGSFPAFPDLVSEEQATVLPGSRDYASCKVLVERVTLEEARAPTTVIRPGAVHGPGSRYAREWYFAKRVLDGRSFVLLGFGGESVFHTTSVDNLAELIRLSAERPGTRVLNCGDPDPPSVLEIARAVYRAAGREPVAVLLPGEPTAGVGETPWSAPRPVVLDMTAAERELGYGPVVRYPDAVGETWAWLVTAGGRQEQTVLPIMGLGPPSGFFDYAAEDGFLAAMSGSAGAGEP